MQRQKSLCPLVLSFTSLPWERKAPLPHWNLAPVLRARDRAPCTLDGPDLPPEWVPSSPGQHWVLWVGLSVITHLSGLLMFI